MSLRNLPAVKAFDKPEGMRWDAPTDAVAKWAPGVSAAVDTEAATIAIYDVIGEDPWGGGGWTARRMAGYLRAIGERDIIVSVNSPGGDFFEGVAIYNELAQHKGKVTIKVMGLAASAASVIAMAGDEIQMGRGAFLMIHNAWGVTVGNRHDMADAAKTLEPFDAAMADIYAHRSGGETKEMAKLMDNETWLGAHKAVELGLADAIVDDEADATGGTSARADLKARHQIDTLLAKQGMPRSERRKLLRDLSGGTQDAAPDATPRAGSPDVAADLRRLIDTLRT